MDIGGPQPAGSASSTNGTFTLTGSGDITAPRSQFHFVYQAMTGDFAITARVVSMTGSGSASGAGLMIRDALAASTDFAAVVVDADGAVGFRTQLQQPQLAAPPVAPRLPHWIRLVRRGAVVAGYAARDVRGFPAAWKRLGDGLVGSGLVYVGMCAAGHGPETSSTAVFDDLAFSTTPQPLLEDGVYIVAPVSAPALVLHATPAASPGRVVDIATPTNTSDQKWLFTKKDHSNFQIQSVADPSLSLTVSSDTPDNGTHVALQPDRGAPSQLWAVVQNNNGSFSLLPQSSPNRGLDDLGGNMKPGTPQDIWQYISSDPHLQWTITPPGLVAQSTTPVLPPTQYETGPDSKPQPGVPQGQTFQFELTGVKYYPGAKSTIWVYVPAEYTPATPACLCVGLDGPGDLVQTVFDNLIYKHQMPVTIGVFISSGTVNKPGTNEPVRFDRCYEFDSTNDNFDRFIMEEVLPAVMQHKAGDGRAIHLSTDPNDHMIYGGSSGGVGAWTAAWQRPDLFRRVFTAIGTYVGMRGADMYPTLIRKTEPKPIRIFLQDGSQDTWNPLFDNWWTQNRSMEESLSFAGYDVNHSWGTLGHEGSHAQSIFPDVVKWLWRDYPQPIKSGTSGNSMLRSVLPHDDGWQPVGGVYNSPSSLCANAQGDVIFTGSHGQATFKLGADGLTHRTGIIGGDPITGEACAADGRLYVANVGDEKIWTYNADGQPGTTVARAIAADHLLVMNNGAIYATEPGAHDDEGSKIWLLTPTGKNVVDTGLHHATGLAISPDHNLLFVAEGHTHWVYSYVVLPDGALQFKQRFYWLHTAESSDDAGDYTDATDMAVDQQGSLYVATRMGIQICDRNGRVEGILTRPEGQVTSLCFGGKNFDTLYMVCGGKIYKRKMQIPGVPGWSNPKPLPGFGAG